MLSETGGIQTRQAQTRTVRRNPALCAGAVFGGDERANHRRGRAVVYANPPPRAGSVFRRP